MSIELDRKADPNVRKAGLTWRIGLWSAQTLLFVVFGAAGVISSFVAPGALAANGMNYATEFPP